MKAIRKPSLDQVVLSACAMSDITVSYRSRACRRSQPRADLGMVPRLNAMLSKVDRMVQRTRARALAAWANPWFRGGVNTGIGLVSLLLLVRSVPLGDVLPHLQPRHLSPLLAIVLFTLLSQLARATRWMLLLRTRMKVRLLDALWINLATQLANYVLPLRAGEALRLWWLAKQREQPAAAALGLIVTDHAFDLGGVTAVLG